MGATGHCWYQTSSSTWSPVKGRKSILGPSMVSITVDLKQDVQLESCELNFIWGKMRTAAQEAALKLYIIF